MRFRIYYGMWEGETECYRYWTYEGCGFADAVKAPVVGVQVIAQEDATQERGFAIINGKDHYVWRPDLGWCGVSDSGVWEYRGTPGFPKYEIWGYALRSDAYHECIRRALREGLGDGE